MRFCFKCISWNYVIFGTESLRDCCLKWTLTGVLQHRFSDSVNILLSLLTSVAVWWMPARNLSQKPLKMVFICPFKWVTICKHANMDCVETCLQEWRQGSKLKQTQTSKRAPSHYIPNPSCIQSLLHPDLAECFLKIVEKIHWP